MLKVAPAILNTTSTPSNWSSQMKIIDCYITAMPESLLDPMPEVHVTFEDGHKEFLFRYYPDEISFNRKEFIGLTRAEALRLHMIKDTAYLQS